MGSLSPSYSMALFFLAFLWPLLNAILLLNSHCRQFCLKFTPYAALPAVALSIVAVQNQGVASFIVPGWLLDTVMGLPPVHTLFLMFTAMVWLFAGLQAAHSIDQKKQYRFYFFFLLAMAGNIRLCIAQDVIGFYSGYAVMSFASFGLVLLHNTPIKRLAAAVYIIYMLASELLLFSALVMVMQANGNLEFATLRPLLAEASNFPALILLIVAFGIKCGMLGCHSWMPPTYRVTPPPAAAVLSGVMVKAGVLGWINMLPLGLEVFPTLGKIAMLLGILGCFYGAVLGVLQTNPKKLLAYSSISQMGLFILAIGIAFKLPNQWLGILPVIAGLALHHSLCKASLFMGTGFLTVRGRCDSWWSWAVFLVISMALAGFLLTSGMVAKSLLKEQMHYLPATLEHLYVNALTITSVATAMLMARFQYLIRPLPKQLKANASSNRWYWWVLALLSQVLPWLLYGDRIKIAFPKLLDALWPVALVVAIGFICYRVKVFTQFVSEASYMQRLLRRKVIAIIRTVHKILTGLFLFEFNVQIPASTWRKVTDFGECVLIGAENQLSRWFLAISITLLLGVLFAVILLLG